MEITNPGCFISQYVIYEPQGQWFDWGRIFIESFRNQCLQWLLHNFCSFLFLSLPRAAVAAIAPDKTDWKRKMLWEQLLSWLVGKGVTQKSGENSKTLTIKLGSVEGTTTMHKTATCCPPWCSCVPCGHGLSAGEKERGCRRRSDPPRSPIPPFLLANVQALESKLNHLRLDLILKRGMLAWRG